MGVDDPLEAPGGRDRGPIEALAEERGIPATIDPAALRFRWFSCSIPQR